MQYTTGYSLYLQKMTGTDWAAWLPAGTCQVGRLIRWPGGPPRQMLQRELNGRTALRSSGAPWVPSYATADGTGLKSQSACGIEKRI